MIPVDQKQNKPFAPHSNSRTLCSKKFKLGGLLGLAFEVSKMTELMKQLLFGNHDNHSITKCFFANY